MKPRKNTMKKLSVLMTLLTTVASATVHFPFPQNISYDYGYNLTSVSASRLKEAFEIWWGNFYVENGNYARIKFDDPNYTVSEGIGYGMLLAVYMSSDTTSYQDEFDKLWAYYNNFLDDNGLMHWKIDGFSQVNQTGAATDAELDVAVALIMAYYQFGDENYKTDALNLLEKIKTYEVDNNYVLKPGDMWDDKKNPSYFSYFGLKLFAAFDSENASFWNNVVNATFEDVLENQSAAGISSDWYAPNNPTDTLSTDMSYDAIRTPWRIALGYAWWGGQDAETYLDKALATFGNTSVSLVNDKIDYETGTFTGTWNNATFVGGVGSIFMRSSAYASQLTAYYNNLENDQDWDISNSYFGGAFDIIYRLTFSGNMPNFMAMSEHTEDNTVPITDFSLERNSSGELQIRISVTDSETDHSYQILSTESLSDPDWQEISDAIAGNGTMLQIEITADSGQTNGFYKLEARPF
ncbi:hypothetical protein EGM51_16265 [Verrucomicrobia bacterium S94]|nr:hypothetical protein EGM51_16265 [Verrucomicrobia bacterium S94]